MALTYKQGKQIRLLRERNLGYRAIAAQLGLSRDTVRNFCTAHHLSGVRAGTETMPEKELARLAQQKYDLTPAGIIDALHLKEVDYNETAAYGHFGKPGLPWEQ